VSEFSSGDILGNVRLDKFLGEGAMGVVYQGKHLTLGLDVAVKILKVQTKNSMANNYAERFRREAQMAARLNHPSIVRVLDFGDKDGTPYMVMELVDGYSFDEYLRRRNEPLNEQTVHRVLLSVANALIVAHDEGIVHRDLKPANLLLNRKGVLKIADLGLAKEDGAAALTREKVLVGSPAYMAPESLVPDKKPDHRCDLYSLGVIGYQLTFGQLPYNGSMAEVAQGHLGGRANFALPTVCSKATIAIVKKLMANKREERYQNAREVVADLRRLFTGVHHKSKGASSSAASSGSGTSDFRNIVNFLENRLGSKSSEIDGKTVVHTTTRERIIVWLLLIGLISLAIAGYVLFGSPKKPTAAVPAPSSTTSTEPANSASVTAPAPATTPTPTPTPTPTDK
jgi:eukaryotic-like serine/threonine-protein kinase